MRWSGGHAPSARRVCVAHAVVRYTDVILLERAVRERSTRQTKLKMQEWLIGNCGATFINKDRAVRDPMTSRRAIYISPTRCNVMGHAAGPDHREHPGAAWPRPRDFEGAC